MLTLLSHLKNKLFRGELVHVQNNPHGLLKLYESGYTSFTSTDGKVTDVFYDTFIRRHKWTIKSTDGSSVVTPKLRRHAAEKYAREIVGVVLFVDAGQKHIFCRGRDNVATSAK